MGFVSGIVGNPACQNNYSNTSTGTITFIDVTPPIVTDFTIPSTSASTTISITTFTATDSIGVTGYKLTETSGTPLPSDPGWTGTAPTTYTFSSYGSKTLYAWAKDAAGNVSISANQSVAIVPTWYFKASTDYYWSNLNNWWSNSDGTGIHPTDNTPWTTDNVFKDSNLSGDVYSTADINIGDGFTITGTCDLSIFNLNTNVFGGTFTGNYIDNSANIYNGIFTGHNFTNSSFGSGFINNGTFTGDGFVNKGEIISGTFTGGVTNSSPIGIIRGGVFRNSLNNESFVFDGTFYGSITNTGYIDGGTFPDVTRDSVGGAVAPYPATRFAGE